MCPPGLEMKHCHSVVAAVNIYIEKFLREPLTDYCAALCIPVSVLVICEDGHDITLQVEVQAGIL